VSNHNDRMPTARPDIRDGIATPLNSVQEAVNCVVIQSWCWSRSDPHGLRKDDDKADMQAQETVKKWLDLCYHGNPIQSWWVCCSLMHVGLQLLLCVVTSQSCWLHNWWSPPGV